MLLYVSLIPKKYMYTHKQGYEQRALLNANVLKDLAQVWRSHLARDYPQDAAHKESIIYWLLGKDLECAETLNPIHVEMAQQAIAYRYRLLKPYLDAAPEKTYSHLIAKLGSILLQHKNVSTLVAPSRDRQSQLVNFLQAFLEELLQSDRYMQQQIAAIAKCTNDGKLRNALLLASLEEYCLSPLQNQPLLLFLFTNYLHRKVRERVTSMSTSRTMHLVSENHQADNNNIHSLRSA